MMSLSVEWATPSALFAELDHEFHFTLDPCCTPESAKCPRRFTREDNGLVQSWGRERVFMNPPYGRGMGAWIKKAASSALDGAFVVALIPARTDTRWWHDWVLPCASEIRFLKGRLVFERPDGPKRTATFPSCVVIYDRAATNHTKNLFQTAR